MSFIRFNRQMRRLSRRLPEVVNVVVKKTALAVDQALVLSTPVDTGRARSNWRVSTGDSVDAEIPAFAPGSRLGIGEGANARAAIAQGQAAIEARAPGQTIYINNNVPYIEQLNRGSSAQAPAMFVEEAIDAGIRTLENTTINLRL